MTGPTCASISGSPICLIVLYASSCAEEEDRTSVLDERTGPERFVGRTFDIAGDRLTGHDFERFFSAAAGRPIPYARFSGAVLEANAFVSRLTAFQDQGRLAGSADLDGLRALVPDLLTFGTWLAGAGRQPFAAALEASGSWAYSA